MSTTTFTLAHFHALDVPRFDIGVLRADDKMIRQLNWTLAKVEHALRWMQLQNLEGAQVFVRPSLAHVSTILVDDIPTPRVRALDLVPAAIVETSPGNSQCWMRLTHAVSIAHAHALQERWDGDPGSADGPHFGRLAGFTNRWPKHRRPNGTFPLVRLMATSQTAYPPEAICVCEPPARRARGIPRRGVRGIACSPASRRILERPQISWRPPSDQFSVGHRCSGSI